MNHAASTNATHCNDEARRRPYNVRQMAAQTPIDQITERVERLLLRHEELQRAHALLLQQVQTLTQERDQLRTRCHLVKQRLDSLIERLPQVPHGEDA